LDQPNLPGIDLIQFEGLYTKSNPEVLNPTQLRECKNVDFFKEYGALSKIRGNELVLNNAYDGGIYWGASYKAQSLSGAITREVLIGAGTTIQKVESDGTLTELLTGEPDALFRTSGQFDRFLYFTSQDPFDIGRAGQMSKYDGERVTKWGLSAPGEQEVYFTDGGNLETPDTPIESFDDSSAFTVVNATVANSTTPAWKGTSTAVTCGSAFPTSSIERTSVTPFSINTVTEDRARMQVFIPREYYRSLAKSGRAISVYIGSEPSFSGNFFRYDFQIGRLFEGWNTLFFDFSTFPTGDFGLTVGDPTEEFLFSYKFEIVTNNASDTPTIYFDRFSSYDQGAPVPTFSTVGTIFDRTDGSIWKYKVTFIDGEGNESNAGVESVAAINTTGNTSYDQILLTDLPISFAPNVIKRRIYRTVAGGSEFLSLGIVNDNVTTTFTDTVSDLSLGSTTPPLIGDLIFDNSPPPLGGIMLIWKRTAFVAGDPLNPTILTYSRYNQPDAFPLANAIELDDRITGIFSTNIGVVVTTETAYWRILGDNPDYVVDKAINGFGNVGPRGVGNAREIGWATDSDGMRLYDLRETIKISEVIRDRVDEMNKSAVEDTHTSHSRKHNAILWFNKDADGVFTDIYKYEYMIDEVRKGWFSQIVPNPSSLNYTHVWEAETEAGQFKLYASTSGGQVHELMADGALNWTDDSKAVRPIELEIQTPYVRLGVRPDAAGRLGQSGRSSPRLVELRAKEANGLSHSWEVLIETCDSASENATVRDSATLTFDFLPGQSLMRISPQDIVPGEYCRFRVRHSEKDRDVSLMGFSVKYLTRPGQFQVQGVSGGGTANAGGKN
tara:strand:+ start:5891 stop:8404 length:2514 start_codon:yes stop_codon:yes gene_type:complete